MAVLVQDPRIQYIADGTHNVFVYPFRIFDELDLDVYLTPAGQTPNPATDILPPSAYTVSGENEEDGGNVTITTIPPINSVITIVRDIPIERLSDYSTGGEFTGISINNALDFLTMVCQQNQSLILDRGVTYLATETLTAGDTTLPKLPENDGNGIPIWTKNSSGALIAAILVEDPDSSTLRSELASEETLNDGARIVGYNNTTIGGPQTVHDALDTLVADVAVIEIAAISLSKNSGRGGELVNNVGDLNNDIDFMPGVWRSSDDTQWLTLITTLTKRLDVNWAAGNGQGGLFTGTKANNTTYHCFYIRKDSDGTIDCGFDTSVTAANRPVGYSTYRRVGSRFTNGSANWVGVIQENDDCILTLPIRDADLNNQGTAAVLVTLSVPKDIQPKANIIALLNLGADGETVNLLITQTNQADTTPSINLFTLLNTTNGNTEADVATLLNIYADANKQIRTRQDAAATTVRLFITTLGWTDDRGRGS